MRLADCGFDVKCLELGFISQFQGNGHERDFMGRKDVFIMDVYNRLVYPRDEQAKKAISKRIELSPFTEDPRYLQAVEEGLEQSLEEFPADLVIYNAGTDILEGDPLGLLSVTRKAGAHALFDEQL
ncbi:hypothetical protein HAZT_HAZT004784 [Hyalella azteca]|uniref:Histone deacetylase domain-containing protein n=1 Tax=Hyalella azteca TaxID=294128 RepID=A0A6A0H3Q0_HYAAZ|nr:hypothetical protein HAZT_HAZT004784 [Hyalella azteca]